MSFRLLNNQDWGSALKGKNPSYQEVYFKLLIMQHIKILNMLFPFQRTNWQKRRTCSSNQNKKTIKITVLHIPFAWAMPPPCGLHSETTRVLLSSIVNKPKAVLLFSFESTLLGLHSWTTLIALPGMHWLHLMMYEFAVVISKLIPVLNTENEHSTSYPCETDWTPNFRAAHVTSSVTTWSK